jgi:hypothetical protein
MRTWSRYTLCYNFARVRQSPRVSPVMELRQEIDASNLEALQQGGACFETGPPGTPRHEVIT